jgi:acyl carrier protein
MCRRKEILTEKSTEKLLAIVLSVLEDTVRDWDMELEGGMSAATTLLGDLAFESIDVVQFAVALETAVGRKGLPFEKLFINDGAYVDDVAVSQIVAFLEEELVLS